MKIALIGYGKMGKMIEQIARDRGHEIVSIIDIDNQQDFDSPAFASCVRLVRKRGRHSSGLRTSLSV